MENLSISEIKKQLEAKEEECRLLQTELFQRLDDAKKSETASFLSKLTEEMRKNPLELGNLDTRILRLYLNNPSWELISDIDAKYSAEGQEGGYLLVERGSMTIHLSTVEDGTLEIRLYDSPTNLVAFIQEHDLKFKLNENDAKAPASFRFFESIKSRLNT